MTNAITSRTTLPERFFPLAVPADVDRLLDGTEWCAIFKAGTSDKTFDAWFLVQRMLEPREDVAVGLVQLPAGRAASDYVTARSGVTHKSPQLIVFQRAKVLAHVDEGAIAADSLVALVNQHLPSVIGPRVQNDRAVSLHAYRVLLVGFVEDRLPEERFQWSYLERLARESVWRDDETFDLLNGLFENPWRRDVRAARLVAHEFQGQLSGRLEPLRVRATRFLELIDRRSPIADTAAPAPGVRR